jgi:hypothetical protein
MHRVGALRGGHRGAPVGWWGSPRCAEHARAGVGFSRAGRCKDGWPVLWKRLSGCRPLVLGLEEPPHIQRGQAHLQRDQRPRLGVHAPHHPQHIAREEHPEADITAALRVRSTSQAAATEAAKAGHCTRERISMVSVVVCMWMFTDRSAARVRRSVLLPTRDVGRFSHASVEERRRLGSTQAPGKTGHPWTPHHRRSTSVSSPSPTGAGCSCAARSGSTT